MALSVQARADKTTATSTIVGAKSIVITQNEREVKTAIAVGGDTIFFRQNFEETPSIATRMSGSGLSLLGKTKQKQKSSVSWDVNSGGVGFGFCSALNAPEAAGLEMGKSFEVSWFHILALEATNRFGNSFSLGIGLDWRNYRTTLGNSFELTNGHVDLAAKNDDDEANLRFSRIKIFSLQFPLLYTQRLPVRLTNCDLKLSFGPIFNVNTHASVMTSWRNHPDNSEYKSNGVNARKLTIDLFASLRVFTGCCLYVRYSPYNVLTGNTGINFQSLSTGMLFLM